MADRIEAFAVTIPASTPITTPATTTLGFADGIVRQIDIRVPPGPAGLMGFVIAYAGVSIVPATDGTWLTMNNEQWSYPVANNPTGGQWQLIGYNTDTLYAHTVYVRFLVDEFTAGAPAPVSIVPIPVLG